MNLCSQPYCDKPVKVKGLCRPHYTISWLKANGYRAKPHKLEYGLAAKKQLLHNYKVGAARRSLEFLLTFEQFIGITSSQCYYCGSMPRQVFGQRYANGKYVYNGVDRLDNCAGYTIQNSVPCCFRCNRSKGTLPVDEFLLMVSDIYKNRCIPAK